MTQKHKNSAHLFSSVRLMMYVVWCVYVHVSTRVPITSKTYFLSQMSTAVLN